MSITNFPKKENLIKNLLEQKKIFMKMSYDKLYDLVW